MVRATGGGGGPILGPRINSREDRAYVDRCLLRDRRALDSTFPEDPGPTPRSQQPGSSTPSQDLMCTNKTPEVTASPPCKDKSAQRGQ